MNASLAERRASVRGFEVVRRNPDNKCIIECKQVGQVQWQEMARFSEEEMALKWLMKLRQELLDSAQRERLRLPKGDLRLGDGRVLRRILGYDLSKLATNELTRNGFLDSAGWRHAPTDFMVSAGVEETERWGPLLHASMSYGDHLPSWEEIKLVREAIFPLEVDTAMILPRQSDYVNVHNFCLHLWQIPTMWGIQ